MNNEISKNPKTATEAGRYRLSQAVVDYVQEDCGEDYTWGEILQDGYYDANQVICIGAEVGLVDSTHVELYFRDMLVEDCDWLMQESTEPQILDLAEAEKDLEGTLKDLYGDYLEMADILSDLPYAQDWEYSSMGDYFDIIKEHGLCMPVYDYDEFVYWMDDMLRRQLEFFESLAEGHI